MVSLCVQEEEMLVDLGEHLAVSATTIKAHSISTGIRKEYLTLRS